MILLAVLAVAGFAAFSPGGAPEPEPLDLPTASGQAAAAALGTALKPEPPPTTQPATTTSSSTTTTTLPPTTTTTLPPTTTTTLPPTTTTTAATTTTTTAPTDTTTTVVAETSWPPAIEQWRALVAAYFPASLVEEALWVIDCETGHSGDPDSYNPSSGASGLFQFLPGTWAWASVNAGWAGADVFDPEANVATAAWLVQDSIDAGVGAWWHWSCQP